TTHRSAKQLHEPHRMLGHACACPPTRSSRQDHLDKIISTRSSRQDHLDWLLSTRSCQRDRTVIVAKRYPSNVSLSDRHLMVTTSLDVICVDVVLRRPIGSDDS